MKTNSRELSLEEIIKAYKNLSEVEDVFRDLKDFIQVQPVFHWKDRRVARSRRSLKSEGGSNPPCREAGADCLVYKIYDLAKFSHPPCKSYSVYSIILPVRFYIMPCQLDVIALLKRLSGHRIIRQWVSGYQNIGYL